MFYKKYFIKIFIIFSFFNISVYGCYSVRFYHDTDNLREVHDGEVYTKSSFYNIFKDNEPAKIRTACPSGASLVEIEQTFLDGFTNFFTLGLYNPQTIRVWCKRRQR